MAEGLIAFGLFILILIFIYWQKRQNRLSALLLGVGVAVNLLIKGTNIFLPVIFLVCIGKRHLFPYLLGLVIIMLPWSVYASNRAGKIVIFGSISPVGRIICSTTFLLFLNS